MSLNSVLLSAKHLGFNAEYFSITQPNGIEVEIDASTSFSTKITGFTTSIATLSTDLSTLEGTVSTQGGSISTINTSITTINSSITDIEGAITALEAGSIDLSSYSNTRIGITATSGDISFTTSGTMTYNGVEVATTADLPSLAGPNTNEAGLVYVTTGNGLNYAASGAISMSVASSTVAGAVRPEAWSSSNLDGFTYSTSTGVLALPATVATSHTSSGGLVSYSVTNNVGTITLTGATSAQVIAGTSSAVVVTPSALAGAKNVAGGYAGVGTDGYIPDSLIKAAVIQQTFFPSVGSYGAASLAVLMAVECKGLITSSSATSYTALDGTTGTIAEGDLVALYSSMEMTYYTKTDGSLVATTDVRLITNGDYLVVVDSSATDGVTRYLVKDAPTTSSGGSAYAPYLDINDDTCMKLIENKDIATTVNVGLVSIGDNITVTATGSISVATATGTALGLVKAGGSVSSISSGVITINTATGSTAGLVTIGDNINLSSGKISVSIADADTLGVVKIGDNIDVDTAGEISVPIATSSTVGVMYPASGLDVTRSGGLSVKGATSTTLGGVIVDESDRLSISSGIISYSNAALQAVAGTSVSPSVPVVYNATTGAILSYYIPTRVRVTSVTIGGIVTYVTTLVSSTSTSAGYAIYIDGLYTEVGGFAEGAFADSFSVEVYVER